MRVESIKRLYPHEKDYISLFDNDKREKLAELWNTRGWSVERLAKYFNRSSDYISNELNRGNAFYDGTLSFSEIEMFEIKRRGRFPYRPKLAVDFINEFVGNREDLSHLNRKNLYLLQHYRSLGMSIRSIVDHYGNDLNMSYETAQR